MKSEELLKLRYDYLKIQLQAQELKFQTLLKAAQDPIECKAQSILIKQTEVLIAEYKDILQIKE